MQKSVEKGPRFLKTISIDMRPHLRREKECSGLVGVGDGHAPEVNTFIAPVASTLVEIECYVRIPPIAITCSEHRDHP